MKWQKIILLVIITLVIFFVQQSLIINFQPVNILLLFVIWLGFWKSTESWIVALLAGLLLDLHSGVVGPAIFSFCLVYLIITYLAQHISLESFSHFLLVSFLGILAFFISYYLLLNIFGVWILSKDLNQVWQISIWYLLKIIFFYQILLIVFYFFKPRKQI